MKIRSSLADRQEFNSIIDSQSDAYLTAYFRLPSNPIDILLSKFWPRAVYDQLIVNTEDQAIRRAKSIISTYCHINSKSRFLDFGCGESRCVEYANEVAKISVGYDITRHTSWKDDLNTTDWAKIIINSPFDIILLYDVIDHVSEDKIDECMQLIKSVSTEDTIIKIRCHPWTSPHGGHTYEKINKAFAHLFLHEDDLEKYQTCYVRKLTDPIKSYEQLFEKHGLQVVDKRIHATDWGLDDSLDFFNEHDMINHLRSMGIQVAKDCTKSDLNISFVDYDLRVIAPSHPFLL